MPTLHGEMPYESGPARPCIWCGGPTDITFVPAGQPELGPQPMHMLCAANLIRAYERMRAGQVLDDRTLGRLRRIQAGQPAT